MNTFDLSKENPIILYGFGTNGVVTLNTFKAKGYKIAAIVDKRAKEICDNNYSVITPEELYKMNELKECVVIITIKNVFCHNEVVKMLIDNDFHNIIYKPYNNLMGLGNLEEDKISVCYDKIIKSAIEQCKIPKTLELIPFPKKDYAKIHETESYIYAYVPITNIFTDINSQDYSPWMNVSLLTQFPHINLFSYFNNRETGNMQDYINFCVEGAMQSGNTGITDLWKLNIINNRFDVFLHMENSFNIDMDFFIRSAPEATYNKAKDLFNLKGGKHRMTYLVSKGLNYLPLKIKKPDYNNWIKNEQIGELSSSNVVIEHPYFYKNLSNNFNYYINFLKVFILNYSKKLYILENRLNLNNLNILINLDDCFIARFLYKMGANISIINNNSKFNDFFLPNNSFNENESNSYDLIITNDLEIIIKYTCQNIIYITKEIVNLDDYSLKQSIYEGIFNGEVYRTILYTKRGEK